MHRFKLLSFILLLCFLLISASSFGQDADTVFSSLTPGFSILVDSTYSNNKPSPPGYMNLENRLKARYISSAIYIPSPDFYLYLISAFTPGEEKPNIEEGYAVYNLPAGFQLKVGKFLSSFGRVNEKHLHSLNFLAHPLIYKHCFGEVLNSSGSQITYLTPLPFYLLIGYENLQGNIRPDFTSSRNINNAFVKYSINPNPDNTILLGASLAQGWDLGNNRVRVQGFDFTFTYWPSGERIYKKLDFQVEYLKKSRINSISDGYYLELNSKYSRTSTISYRFDSLNDPLSPQKQTVHSVAFQYSPNEFQKFRILASYDNINKRIYPAFQFMQMLQMGQHPAHSF